MHCYLSKIKILKIILNPKTHLNDRCQERNHDPTDGPPEVRTQGVCRGWVIDEGCLLRMTTVFAIKPDKGRDKYLV